MLTSTASRPDQMWAVPIHAGARPPGISRYIAKADTSWNTANPRERVASHDLTAVPLEKPVRLMAKNLGSCNWPNTPSATAVRAPISTVTSTVRPLAEFDCARKETVGSDIVTTRHRRRCERPLLVADRQVTHDRAALVPARQATRAVDTLQRHLAVDSATGQPCLDALVIAGIGGRGGTVHFDVEGEIATLGGNVAVVLNFCRKGCQTGSDRSDRLWRRCRGHHRGGSWRGRLLGDVD